MPPKKRRGQPSHKAQLLFLQQPREGPKHHCRPAQQLPTHTLQVPSKPIEEAFISWVSPQFDTAVESLFPARRKHRRDRARLSSQKSTRKFPHLIFESPQSSSSPETPGIPSVRKRPSQSEKDVSKQPLVPMLSPQSCGEPSAHALPSSPCVFAAPDIQTPGPSVREDLSPPGQEENSFPVYTSTPCSPEPVPVLVEDTPEEKYGVKVTWRRRRHLLAYLRERGKLSGSQFLGNG
ncbi:PREDICTED: RAD9, HUS1, RAD1-interacting nuclear orphan protein 1 isoform X2 [Chinchilla lanigera]|uniref:RAD9-HUS1-RAD1 interacting nuclear orphan 1 n=2 Tax=Chinchilla lanigera TaxID=34839 RepID=A0A8C2WC13_CHILA|nr:PREDICTED: RAD9, HUS1, RAD1-interacting nuclear orphan protein 1 isoform X2 [Chinchilla lanigera]XP_005387184.1 PREDICTED: RAD9, HUS1, RAD1-interacting nuclear orphan protein 1 isoform X2 [Chinchilla lanigera]XP_005387185.1 PREDICTED: RAD9, HUS1, RAD1-interacting nuclear orphan protein 1 isoform X2 [Chinchilla lanigera]XP_013370929.1 PREDICTED: RAD9, HUS1, RAD1-interacting nuclear orphan protein 1 isoform X2 [Chinchilla lanigera]